MPKPSSETPAERRQRIAVGRVIAAAKQWAKTLYPVWGVETRIRVEQLRMAERILRLERRLAKRGERLVMVRAEKRAAKRGSR
jgi:hypothetical protein